MVEAAATTSTEDFSLDIIQSLPSTTKTSMAPNVVGSTLSNETDENHPELAKTLAPALQHLDYLLTNPTRDLLSNSRRGSSDMGNNDDANNDDNDDDDEDDDSMDQELSRLAESEQLLRQELEFAHNFGALLGGGKDDDDDNDDHGGDDDRLEFSMSALPTVQDNEDDAAAVDDDDDYPFSDRPSWLIDPASMGMSTTPTKPPVERTNEVIDEPTQESSDNIEPDSSFKDDVKVVKTASNGKKESLQGQELLSDEPKRGPLSMDTSSKTKTPDKTKSKQQSNNFLVASPPTTQSSKSNTNKEKKKAPNKYAYTLQDHTRYLQMQTEARGGWYHIPLIPLADDGSVLEYVIPVPEQELQRLYVGIILSQESFEQETSYTESASTPIATNTDLEEDGGGKPTHKQQSLQLSSEEQLPIRIVGVRIRPDVLVGVVMDALAGSAAECNAEIIKRQGGHLVYVVDGLRIDCQLCSYKGSVNERYCARTLLIRVFLEESEIDKGDEIKRKEEQARVEAAVLEVSQQDVSTTTPGVWEPTPIEELDVSSHLMHPVNSLLQEAAALVQKLETSRRGGGNEAFFNNSYWRAKPVYPSKQALQTAVSQQLLATYKPCPSVNEGQLTLPSLSKHDLPLVRKSFKHIQACWNELVDRDLSYNTLKTGPRFGQFPALSTLDNHYCSQLRRLCRENMIVSLLKSASELEQYARESEYGCANLVQVLQPTFDAYDMVSQLLPQPLPLTEYPLDFIPHSQSCPPWGMRVMEALNQVSAIDKSLSSQHSADKAVKMVLEAFQKQDDEEQSARLGRKNLQIMDRLAKMQAHKRSSMELLHRNAYRQSPKAQKAAKEFYQYAAKYCKKRKLPVTIEETSSVPLFKCSILVGGATGTVYVTATHIMCVTQMIPVIGGNSVAMLEALGRVSFLVDAVSDSNENNNSSGLSSLLNPLPTSMAVIKDGVKIYSFRPSYGASRLKTFLEVVQTLLSDGLYMYGDNQNFG